jgi:hypothetical protein
MSRRMKESHVSSAIMDAIPRYSASALDKATNGCLFTLQKIQLLPKKEQ